MERRTPSEGKFDLQVAKLTFSPPYVPGRGADFVPSGPSETHIATYIRGLETFATPIGETTGTEIERPDLSGQEALFTLEDLTAEQVVEALKAIKTVSQSREVTKQAVLDQLGLSNGTEFLRKFIEDCRELLPNQTILHHALETSDLQLAHEILYELTQFKFDPIELLRISDTELVAIVRQAAERVVIAREYYTKFVRNYETTGEAFK